MKTDEKRSPHDEQLQRLRRELLERIVRNEARRRTERNGCPKGVQSVRETATGTGGPNG